MNAESEMSVRFSKSRSPPKHRLTQEIDGLTEDLFLPLVAGDEFEEQEVEGNLNFWYRELPCLYT